MRTDIVQQRRIELAIDGCRDERERIHRLESLPQAVDSVAIRDVALGDDEAIGHGRLFCGLMHRVELPDAVDGVDQGHDTVQPVLRAPSSPSVCRVWSTGIGSASPLVSTNTRSKSMTSPARRLTNSSRRGFLKVGAQRAAQAAVAPKRHLLRRSRDQLEIERHIPESLMMTAARSIPG